MTGSEEEAVAPSVGHSEGVERGAAGELSLDDHLEIIRKWQKDSGKVGRSPPKATFPKTSNFVQWARKRVRDAGDRRYAQALASVGIEATKARPDAGLAGACSSLLAFVEGAGRPPEMDADDKAERHLAVWLIRIQSGIVPSNHAEARADGQVNQLMRRVVELMERQQSDIHMAGQWFELCARTHDLLPRLNKGNTWGSRLAEATQERISQMYPWLRVARHSVTARRAPQLVWAPDPVALISELNASLGCLDAPVKFRTDRDATKVFRMRLERCGLAQTQFGLDDWVKHRALPH